MSDNYTDHDEYDDGDEPTPAEDFKNLRAKAKKADKYEQENLSLRRELAFTKAGINMSDPRMTYFVKGYDGDLSPDAIRGAAVSAGFITEAASVPDEAAEAVAQGQAAVAAAAAGSNEVEFNLDSVAYEMQQAIGEGGLEGLAAVSEKYGVTFNTPNV